MARPPENPQPVLPGMGHLGPQFTPEVKQHAQRLGPTAKQWSGPIPGQTVIGMMDESHVAERPGGGPWKTDPHGNISERHIDNNDDANRMYGTYGGGHAKTADEHFADSGMSPDQIKERRAEAPSYFAQRDRRTAHVQEHWASQPVHMIRTDTPIHTGQLAKETVDPKTNGRRRVSKIRKSLEAGQPLTTPAWIMKSQGRLYALDGHHRMLAAREAGLSHFPAHVWDRDAEGR